MMLKTLPVKLLNVLNEWEINWKSRCKTRECKQSRCHWASTLIERIRKFEIDLFDLTCLVMTTIPFWDDRAEAVVLKTVHFSWWARSIVCGANNECVCCAFVIAQYFFFHFRYRCFVCVCIARSALGRMEVCGHRSRRSRCPSSEQ